MWKVGALDLGMTIKEWSGWAPGRGETGLGNASIIPVHKRSCLFSRGTIASGQTPLFKRQELIFSLDWGEDSWGQWCELCSPLRGCPGSIHQAQGWQSSLDHWQISILSWPHPHLLEADVIQCVRELIKLLDGNFLKLTFLKIRKPTSLANELREELGLVFWQVEALAQACSWMDEFGTHWVSPGQLQNTPFPTTWPPLPLGCILWGFPTAVPPLHSCWSVFSKTA